jgi:DNA-binding response OmpR family regulator
MKKILIVEDDAFLQGLEAGKLKKSGYDIVSARNGNEAMEKIMEPGIDLVLLDLILPDFNGFEILEKIRATKGLEKLPILVFSNLSEEKDVQKTKELGALDFMVKSNFTLDELVIHIQTILNK